MKDQFDRRTLLQTLAIGAAASAIPATNSNAAATPTTAADWQAKPDRDGRLRFTVEYAVLGHTDAPNPSGRIGDPRTQDYFNTDVRGDNYYVEGVLYPGGTIPAPTVPTPLSVFPQAPKKLHNEVVWDFKAQQPIGHWLNRGWVLINGRRQPYTDPNGTVVDTPRLEPHMLSEHTFVFGNFGPDSLSPDMLITSGVENGNDPDIETVTRAVTGGTGRFAHVSGQVVHTRLGRNTTNLRSFSHKGEVKSPNYRATFDLRLK
ncbi:MAG: hypothetical protein R3F58_09175 [Steroidobacteraceae bacterium]